MTSAHHPVNAGPLELFVCGWDEVALWRFAPPTAVSGGRQAAPPETIWRWQARAADGLPAAYRDLFNPPTTANRLTPARECSSPAQAAQPA